MDVEEFSDAENVSAASSSRSPAPSCDEDDEELLDDDDEDDGKSSKCSSSGHKQQSGSGKSSSIKKKGKKKSKEPVNHLIKPRCNCDELMAVDCQLETKELWDKFHELGTEMIITKTGR